MRCAFPIRLYSGATTSWYSARMSPLAPQGSDSDTPRRHGHVLLRSAKSDRTEPFATNSWPWWQRKRAGVARYAPLDEFGVPHWRSQHDDDLLHDWVQGLGSSGKILASWVWSHCGSRVASCRNARLSWSGSTVRTRSNGKLQQLHIRYTSSKKAKSFSPSLRRLP